MEQRKHNYALTGLIIALMVSLAPSCSHQPPGQKNVSEGTTVERNHFSPYSPPRL